MNDLHAFLIIRDNRVIGYLSMQASFQDVRKLLYAGYLVIPNKDNHESGIQAPTRSSGPTH